MISNELKIRFRKDGVILLKNFFESNEIDEIREQAKSIFISQFKTKGYIAKEDQLQLDEESFNRLLFRFFKEDLSTFQNCGKQAQHLISLHKLGVNDKLISTLKHLDLSYPNISTRPVMFFNHPKLAIDPMYNKVKAHQDWKSMQGSINSVVVWIPLVDVNNNNGSVRFWPGSHKKGLITSEVKMGFGLVEMSDTEKQEMISFDMEKGDIAIFSSFLVHESGDNNSDSPRWSCHFRFNDLNEPTFISRGVPNPYKYYPIEEMITPNFPSISDIAKYYNEYE